MKNLWKKELLRFSALSPGFDSRTRHHTVGCVCCWFPSLFREVFLRVLRFSPLLNNQHFQIQFDLDYCQARYYEPLAQVIAQALPVFDTYFKNLHLHFHLQAVPWVSNLLTRDASDDRVIMPVGFILLFFFTLHLFLSFPYPAGPLGVCLDFSQRTCSIVFLIL